MQIMVSYLQVAAIVKSAAVNWPSPMARLLSAFSSVSSGASTAVSIECSLPKNDIRLSIQKVGCAPPPACAGSVLPPSAHSGLHAMQHACE